jgi:hypothetical protein
MGACSHLILLEIHLRYRLDDEGSPVDPAFV